MRSFLLPAMLTFVCSAAVAQDQSVRVFLNGNDLLARCAGAGYDAGVCEGYIMAIADAMSGGNSILGAHACIDVHVTSAQVRDVVVAALRRDPATRHLAARSLAASAIADAFRCH